MVWYSQYRPYFTKLLSMVSSLYQWRRGIGPMGRNRAHKVNREGLLICGGHNLLRLFRHGTGDPGNARGNVRHGNCRFPRLIAGKFLQILWVFTNPHRLTLVVSR